MNELADMIGVVSQRAQELTADTDPRGSSRSGQTPNAVVSDKVIGFPADKSSCGLVAVDDLSKVIESEQRDRYLI